MKMVAEGEYKLKRGDGRGVCVFILSYQKKKLTEVEDSTEKRT